ncbi:MAG: relaxase/mobilization nuclease domain-containing protein, partial [Clostridia bacterium]|nr:relaxase/mobilization nuclease domain-containing protein [Clostridia bacterium]
IRTVLKTDTTQQQMLVAALHCLPEQAHQEMMQTKERWDKKNGVQGYHIIHSFAPGEVTPEQAQELGVEFARRLLGERFEAVVSTHVDHEHIHCHIVFNSVSFMDGKMYRSDFKAYFGDIRGISNDVSRENNLSVIEPKGKGKHYAEWHAEQSGKPTIRGLIRQDLDAAISDGFTLQSVFSILEKRGYAVKRGANIKHTAVRPPGGSRFVRLESLGPEYTEEAIKRRLHREPEAKAIIKVTRYKVKRGTARRPRKKLKGFKALYVRYLYLLGLRKPMRYRRPVSFETRKEVLKLQKYSAQFSLLQKYRIENPEQLEILSGALQANVDALVDKRRKLYRLKRRGEDVTKEISQINLELRPIRRELRLCRQIAETVPRLQNDTEQYRREMQEKQAEKSKRKERRTELWK